MTCFKGCAIIETHDYWKLQSGSARQAQSGVIPSAEEPTEFESTSAGIAADASVVHHLQDFRWLFVLWVSPGRFAQVNTPLLPSPLSPSLSFFPSLWASISSRGKCAPVTRPADRTAGPDPEGNDPKTHRQRERERKNVGHVSIRVGAQREARRQDPNLSD